MSVSDFIMKLERTFQIAFGRDHMSLDTRMFCYMASYKMVLELTWLVRHLLYQELKITENFVLQQKMKKGGLQS